MYWRHARSKADVVGRELVRHHYSRQKPDSPQFLPPGETILLIHRDLSAVWGWWRPYPPSGMKMMNGHDGWMCSVFSNQGATLSSDLVIDAEYALAIQEEFGLTAGPCGPSGMMTYVWREKVKSPNPGYCYKVAGWKKIGVSSDGKKDLLSKPFAQAGLLP